MKKHFKQPRTYIILLLVAIAITGGFYVKVLLDKDNEINSSFEKARDASSNRDYSQAVKLYKEAINESPGLADAYYEAASILVLKSQYDEAKEVLLKGISHADNPAKIHALLAEVYVHEKDFANAYTQIDKASSLDNDNWKYKIDKINYLALQKDYEKALNTAKDVSNDDAYGNFIKALANFENMDEALKLAQKANELSEDAKYTSLEDKIKENLQSPDAKIENYARLTSFAIEQKEFGIALVISDNIKNQNNYYEGSYIYQAYVLSNYGVFEESNTLLETAELYAPSNQDIFKIKAKNYYQMEDFAQADASIQKAKMSLDAGEDLLELEAQIKFELGDYASVINLADTILRSEPENFEYLRLKALSLLLKQDYSALSAFIDETLSTIESLGKEQIAILGAIKGWGVYNQGQKAEAKEILDIAYSNFPRSSYVNYYLGLFYLKQDQKDQADKYIQEAINIDTQGYISKLALEETSK